MQPVLTGKTLTVSVHQPSLFPWGGFWHKYLCSDAMIWYERGIKLSDSSTMHRVKLDGSWMSLELDRKTCHGDLNEVRFNPVCLKTIAKRLHFSLSGKRHPYAFRLNRIMEYLYDCPTDYLCQFNKDTMRLMAEGLGLQDLFVEQKHLPVGDTTADRLDSLFKDGGYLVYMSGGGARSYMDKTSLKNVLTTRFQTPKAPDETALRVMVDYEVPSEVLLNYGSWSE